MLEICEICESHVGCSSGSLQWPPCPGAPDVWKLGGQEERAELRDQLLPKQWCGGVQVRTSEFLLNAAANFL